MSAAGGPDPRAVAERLSAGLKLAMQDQHAVILASGLVETITIFLDGAAGLMAAAMERHELAAALAASEERAAAAEARAEVARAEALEEAARIAETPSRHEREWVPNSLWDAISRDTSARIRAAARALQPELRS